MSDPVKIEIVWYSGNAGPSELDLMSAFEQLIKQYKWPLLAQPDFIHEARRNEIRRAVNWLHAKVNDAPTDSNIAGPCAFDACPRKA